MLYIFRKLFSSQYYATLACNVATYRFRDIRGQNLGFSGPLGVPPMGRLCYRRAKFHVDRCHRRRDICNRTKTYSRFNMRPNSLRLSIIKQTIMIITYHPDVCSEVLMCKALGGKESSTVLSLGPSLLHFIVYRCYFAFCQSALNESHAAKS